MSTFLSQRLVHARRDLDPSPASGSKGLVLGALDIYLYDYFFNPSIQFSKVDPKKI
jgi:hypothetical protein